MASSEFNERKLMSAKSPSNATPLTETILHVGKKIYSVSGSTNRSTRASEGPGTGSQVTHDPQVSCFTSHACIGRPTCRDRFHINATRIRSQAELRRQTALGAEPWPPHRLARWGPVIESNDLHRGRPSIHHHRSPFLRWSIKKMEKNTSSHRLVDVWSFKVQKLPARL